VEQLCLQINDLFLELYREVYEHEKEALLRGEFEDISFNDVHIINAVGMDRPRNMSVIAKSMSVTVGSLTTAMNGLVKKGYVYRERSAEDRRVIYIRLTPKGEKVYTQHEAFHKRVTETIAEGLGQETLEHMLKYMRIGVERAKHIR